MLNIKQLCKLMALKKDLKMLQKEQEQNRKYSRFTGTIRNYDFLQSNYFLVSLLTFKSEVYTFSKK